MNCAERNESPQPTTTRAAVRPVAAGGMIVAMAAVLGMAGPIDLASSMVNPDAAVGMARVLSHPDAALVAPSHVVAWTSITLAVCIFLSRHAQIAIARPVRLHLALRSVTAPRFQFRPFIRTCRTGGLYGG